jgi:hypothetical protein
VLKNHFSKNMGDSKDQTTEEMMKHAARSALRWNETNWDAVMYNMSIVFQWIERKAERDPDFDGDYGAVYHAFFDPELGAELTEAVLDGYDYWNEK